MAKKIIEKQNIEIPAQIDNTKTYNTKNNTFIRNEGTPNINVLPSDSPLGLVPLVGDALQVLDIPFNIANKQYGMAALNAGMLFVPNLIEKPIRWVNKGIKSRKLAKSLNKIDLENLKFKENINNKNIITDLNINKPNNVSTINIDGTDIEIHKLKERFNKWADYYGYDKLPENIKLDEIENFMKSTFDKHNTYYRGLTLPYTPEDIAKVKTVLGENASDEEILNYLAKTGRPGGTFVSPVSNAAIYGDNKNVAILRRKYNLGENPKTWLDDADFNITDEGIKENIEKGIISYPWGSIFDSKTIPNELRININDFEHVGWLPRTIEYNDIGKVIDINDFNGSKNVYINQMRGEKPKFKFGGIKQDKIFKLNGGMAVPLDDKKRLFYLSGAKHEQGGIDVTPELEAEGGEVIKVNPKSIKVVTAQKIMGGKSPAELVVDASSTGEQDKVFNEVFKYQEDFKDRYNLNDDGTKKAKWGIFEKFKDINVKDKLKDIAYKIISQDNVSDKGKAGIVDIVKGLFNDKPKVDDNKKMFLYGNVNGLPPVDTTKGKDFTKYIQENYPDKKISQYEGIINPYNEYIIDEKHKNIIENLAKNKKHIYSTLEDEYIDYIETPHPDTMDPITVKRLNTPYKDDVHNYPLQFDIDNKGNIIAHAADLYDFNYKDYLKKFQFLKAAEAAALNSIGNPYILRQNNIPVRFINLNEKSDYSPQIDYKGREYDMNLTDEEKRAVNFNHILKNLQLVKKLGGQTKNITKKKIMGGDESTKTWQQTSREAMRENVSGMEDAIKYLNTNRQERYNTTGETSSFNEFTNNWYNHPTTRKMMEELNTKSKLLPSKLTVPTTSGEISLTPSQQMTYHLHGAMSTPMKQQNIEGNTAGQYSRPEFGNINLSNTARLKSNNYFNLNVKDPKYLDDFIRLDLNKGMNPSYLKTHEIDHAIQTRMPFLLDTTKEFDTNLKEGVVSDPYLDSKEEIRSRIMELRQHFNLDPSKRDYTPEEASKFQEELKNLNMGASTLDRYTPETLANYLNFMANNTVNKSYNNLYNTTNIKGRKMAKLGTQYTDKPTIPQLNVPSNMIGSATIQTPTPFVIKEWEDRNKINLNNSNKTDKLLNTRDWINLGLNSVGALANLIGGLATPNIKYARMKDPIPIIAPKINTNVNTTAEENAIDDAYYNELKSINENTANSKVALNRIRNASARRAAAKVKIRSVAENTRRDLINKSNILKSEYDKFNIQRYENVQNYNTQAEAAEHNANRTKVNDAITGFINDLALGASTITNTLERREADRINTVLSYMGNPEVNQSEFGKGFDDIYIKLYGKKPSKYLIKKYSKR